MSAPGFPRRFARTARGFVSPQRNVGQLPLGRFVIVCQLLAAVVFCGYTLAKKSIRLPFADAPYQVEVVLPDAKGLDRVDEPGAAVAGALVGRVTGVRYEDGRAVATLTMDPEMRGKLFADASAELRPASAIQNLIVNLDPGRPSLGRLPDGEPIPAARTTAFVAFDELTGMFDADTSAYAQILIAEAERGLRGRESDLRAGLGELAELTETATPISRTLATRRRLVTRLVGELDTVMTTLGERSAQLGTAVAAGDDTLAVTAEREAELAALTRALAPALVEAERSLDATGDLADLLAPALDRLVPVTGDLGEAMAKLRVLLPEAEVLVGQFDELTIEGAEPAELLLRGTRGLPRKVKGLVPTARDLLALTRLMDRYKGGAAQLADTLSGATSVNDTGGAYGQVDVLEFEQPKPENLGLPPAAARDRGRRPSPLQRKLALALERTCPENPSACVLRFMVPGLPDEPLTRGERGGR